MTRSLMGTLLGTVLLVGGCSMMHHDEKEVKIAPADAPPAVLASFEKAYPGAKITEIEKENDDGMTHYEITYKGDDGKSHEIELDSNGKILADH